MVFAICAGLLLAVGLVFGQTVDFDFVNYDDPGYVYENAPVTGGLTGHGISWSFSRVHLSNWHPLTWIAHMADCQLFGLWPGGHHLTSVLLHAATAVLLFLVLRQMTSALWPSALAAALFAIHPLRAESVAWVAERKDVLSGLFFVLTLAAYLCYVRRPFSRARYLAVLTLFACGLMAKQMLVTLPCVLLLLDWWPLGRLAGWPSFLTREPDCVASASGLRLPLATLFLEKIPFFALVAAACGVAAFAQGESVRSLQQFSLATRAANAAVAYVAYLVQSLLPLNLAVFYPHPGDSLPGWQVAGSVAALVALTMLLVMQRRRYPFLLVGWLWFLGMLVPVIGIVQVGSQARADRYTYLPQIGLCIAASWGAAELARAWSVPRRAQATVAILILAAFLFGARRQTSYWRNGETLWTHALACTNDNWMAHSNLAALLIDRNQLDEAILHCNAALKRQPSSVEAHYNLGTALARQGRTSEAIAHYNQALELQPNHAEAHNNLGIALDSQGQTAQAAEHYLAALEIQPDYATAHYNLANNLASQGQLDAAISHYESALQLEPQNARALRHLAFALTAQGRGPEAMRRYEQVLKLDSRNAAVHNSLGELLATEHRAEEAIEHFRAAAKIDPRFLPARLNLVDALAAQGNRAGAIAECQQALAVADAQHNRRLGEALHERLSRYRATLGTPAVP